MMQLGSGIIVGWSWRNAR